MSGIMYGMARRRRRTVGVRRRRLVRGAGFFGDLWSGVKKAASAIPWRDVGNYANNYLKDSKLLSGNLGRIPGIGGMAAGLAEKAGYGRRRRRVGGMVLVKRRVGAARRRRPAVRRTRVGGRRYRTLMF